MKAFIMKYKKVIISVVVILLSIFLYSNKPYSLYEVSYIKQINNQNIENSKDFYLEKIKKSIVNKDYIKKHIFFVKKNQNLGFILKKIRL